MNGRQSVIKVSHCKKSPHRGKSWYGRGPTLSLICLISESGAVCMNGRPCHKFPPLLCPCLRGEMGNILHIFHEYKYLETRIRPPLPCLIMFKALTGPEKFRSSTYTIGSQSYKFNIPRYLMAAAKDLEAKRNCAAKSWELKLSIPLDRRLSSFGLKNFVWSS